MFAILPGSWIVATYEDHHSPSPAVKTRTYARKGSSLGSLTETFSMLSLIEEKNYEE